MLKVQVRDLTCTGRPSQRTPDSTTEHLKLESGRQQHDPQSAVYKLGVVRSNTSVSTLFTHVNARGVLYSRPVERSSWFHSHPVCAQEEQAWPIVREQSDRCACIPYHARTNHDTVLICCRMHLLIHCNLCTALHSGRRCMKCYRRLSADSDSSRLEAFNNSGARVSNLESVFKQPVRKCEHECW